MTEATQSPPARPGRVRVTLAFIAWALLAVVLHTAVHFLNLVKLQGFPLGFYMAAQGAPIALVCLAFWWSRNDPQAGLVGGIRTASLLLTPVLVLALVGLLYSAGHDGLLFGLAIIAGLALAVWLLPGTPSVQRQAQTDEADTPVPVPGFSPVLGLVIAVCLAPLVAAHILFLTKTIELIDAPAVAYMAAAIAALAALVAMLPIRGVVSGLLGVVLLAGLVAAIALATLLTLGAPDQSMPIAQLSYGLTLEPIKELERNLIVDGLADPAAVHQHARPFTSWSTMNFFALLTSMAFGSAALAIISTAPAVTRSRRAVSSGADHFFGRRTLAWASLLVLALTITLPSIAAFAKLEFYTAVRSGISADAGPDWSKQTHAAGILRYCTDAGGAAATHTAVDVVDPTDAQDPEAQADADTSAAPPCAGPPPNLALDDISFREANLALIATAMVDSSGAFLQPVIYALLIAAFIGAAGLLRFAGSVARLGTSGGAHNGTSAVGPLLIVATAGLAAGLLHVWGGDETVLAASGFALLGASVFPAVVMAAARPDGSRFAQSLAAITGLVATGAYLFGSAVFPTEFALQSQAISSAPEWKFDELLRLQNECVSGEAQACLDRDAFAPELANWWGLKPHASAVLGAPVGLLVGMFCLLIQSLSSGVGRK